MKRIGMIAATGTALVFAVSCAGGNNGNSAQPGNQQPAITTAPSSTTPGSLLPQGATPLDAAKVNAAALPKDNPRTVWTEDNGRTVGVRGIEGGCSRASAVLAGQDGKSVNVTVIESKQRTRQACTMDLRYPKLAVNLGKPLGDRSVTLTAKKESE